MEITLHLSKAQLAIINDLLEFAIEDTQTDDNITLTVSPKEVIALESEDYISEIENIQQQIEEQKPI